MSYVLGQKRKRDKQMMTCFESYIPNFTECDETDKYRAWLRLPTYEKLIRELPTSRYSEEEDHGRDMNEQVTESEIEIEIETDEFENGTIKEIGYISNLFSIISSSFCKMCFLSSNL